jgi:hypothetical protein
MFPVPSENVIQKIALHGTRYEFPSPVQIPYSFAGPRQTRAKWNLIDPIFAANVSPMKCVNQTRTNVINRLPIHQDLRAFFDPDTRS